MQIAYTNSIKYSLAQPRQQHTQTTSAARPSTHRDSGAENSFVDFNPLANYEF